MQTSKWHFQLEHIVLHIRNTFCRVRSESWEVRLKKKYDSTTAKTRPSTSLGRNANFICKRSGQHHTTETKDMYMQDSS